jgi:hypothetical protein
MVFWNITQNSKYSPFNKQSKQISKHDSNRHRELETKYQNLINFLKQSNPDTKYSNITQVPEMNKLKNAANLIHRTQRPSQVLRCYLCYVHRHLQATNL